jgi:hypothetical protein
MEDQPTADDRGEDSNTRILGERGFPREIREGGDSKTKRKEIWGEEREKKKIKEKGKRKKKKRKKK